MKQIQASWEALDTRRRVIVAGATILVFAAVLALSGMASKPNMALLYAGLDPAQAGEVVTALEQQGVRYEVRGDAIHVDASRRDELRMMLAAEGLPKADGKGYELLDSLSGFGTTSQMFDAAYWRAKEGELSRTILANTAIRTARVHIAAAAGPSFRNDNKPTASVTITTASGGLPPKQAKALQFMVASAVAGMRPEDVSVIDSAGGLISVGEATSLQIGDDRAESLRRNVERLLEARVGYGNAVVELNVQTVSEREAITERRLDPQSRVVVSTENTETTKQSDATKSPNVTVASNLPEGDAANNGRSQSQASEARERTNYEVSEMTRELLRVPGDIKRITVAVLVDGIEGADGSGQTTIVPRPQEELDSLRELVASAVGLDESRGDVITLRSMPFRPVATSSGTEAVSGFLSSRPLDVTQLIYVAVLAIVAIVLAIFVLRPLLLGRRELVQNERTQQLDRPLESVAEPDIVMGNAMPTMIAPYSPQDLQTPQEQNGDFEEANQDPVARLKNLIEKRQAESLEILRNWMDGNEGRA